MVGTRAILRGLASTALVLCASGALADAIDGDWCAEDGSRSLHIHGPSITTPTGRTITGNYSRHAFSYVVPEGDPGSGSTVHMRLLNEEEVRVFFDPETPEIWRRCNLNV
ncbi:MAG: hypothetical protein WCD16_01095 [Paracoccaceae bacterium]